MGCFCSKKAGYLGEIVGVVHEPKVIQVNFVREETKPLGLRLQRNGGGIFVRAIECDGVVSGWNEQHPSMQVSFGDKLIAVNGVQVDPSWKCWCSILLELRKDTVTMALTRSRAGEISRIVLVPPPTSDTLDYILPANFLDSMAKQTAAECDVMECCICLEELDADSTVVQLPCKHAFHRGCAETWLTQCPTFKFAKCPICRQQIGTPPGASEVLGANGAATAAVRQR